MAHGKRIKKLIESLKIDKEDAQRIDYLLTQMIKVDDWERFDAMFDDVNTIMNGNGIETLNAKKEIDSYWKNTAYLYVNMGDTYDQTIIYNIATNRFVICSWGSIVEAHTERFE